MTAISEQQGLLEKLLLSIMTRDTLESHAWLSAGGIPSVLQGMGCSVSWGAQDLSETGKAVGKICLV